MPYKFFFNILLFTILFHVNISGQDSLTSRLTFIQNLSSYRSKLIISDTCEYRKIGKMISKYNNLIEDKTLRNDILTDIFYISGDSTDNLKPIKHYIKNVYGHLKIVDSLNKEDIMTLNKNSRLLDLISYGVLNDTFPFTLTNCEDILEEMKFYDIKDTDIVAEIGAGKGTFSLLMYFAHPEIYLLINEINNYLLNYIMQVFATTSGMGDLSRIYFFKGSNKSTTINVKVDKIIIRNAFHHFIFPNRMLKSIFENLNDNGTLFINEEYQSSDPKKCFMLRTREFIIKHAMKAGFSLIEEKALDDRALLKFKKV